MDKYSILYTNSNRDSLAVHKIVSDCQKEDGLIKAATYINERGIITETQPSSFEKFKGRDVSNQPHVRYIKKNKVKFISRKFMAVQGFEAFSFINPIVDNNTFLGTMNILFEPNKFIQKLLSDFDLPHHSKLIILQGDGVVLFSDLKQFRGTNVVMYDKYRDNLAEYLIKTIGRKKSGEFSFFYNFENRKIKIFWNQISMEKDKWSVVLINPI